MPLLPIDDSGERIQALRPGSAQAVAFDDSSAVGAPFGVGTTVVRVVATSACFVVFGQSPVATASGHYLPAGAPEYFRVVPGEKAAVCAAGPAGTLYLSEMT